MDCIPTKNRSQTFVSAPEKIRQIPSYPDPNFETAQSIICSSLFWKTEQAKAAETKSRAAKHRGLPRRTEKPHDRELSKHENHTLERVGRYTNGIVGDRAPTVTNARRQTFRRLLQEKPCRQKSN